jgi:hypothetical protein
MLFSGNAKMGSSLPTREVRFPCLTGPVHLEVHFPPQEERNGNQKEEGGPREEKDVIRLALEKV